MSALCEIDSNSKFRVVLEIGGAEQLTISRINSHHEMNPSQYNFLSKRMKGAEWWPRLAHKHTYTHSTTPASTKERGWGVVTKTAPLKATH